MTIFHHFSSIQEAMVTIVRAFVVVAITLGVTFLPFLPGGYDALSNPLSEVAWVLGRAGLLLVPVAVLWLVLPGHSNAGKGPRGWLVWLTLGTCILVVLVLVLVAFAFGLLLASATGAIAGVIILRFARRLRTRPMDKAVAGLLAIGPILVLAAQVAFIDPIAGAARDRVIANSAPLIAAIERYHARNGVYPASIFALYGDVKPGIIGVQRYFYEPSGDAYNLIFEEPSPTFALRRFVVYNPHDAQRLTVHETDRLVLDEAGLDADNAGYTIVEPLPQPHWKLFTFRS